MKDDLQNKAKIEEVDETGAVKAIKQDGENGKSEKDDKPAGAPRSHIPHFLIMHCGVM